MSFAMDAPETIGSGTNGRPGKLKAPSRPLRPWSEEVAEQAVGHGETIASRLGIDVSAAMAGQKFVIPDCTCGKPTGRISKRDVGRGGTECGCTADWRDWVSATRQILGLDKMNDAADMVADWIGYHRNGQAATTTPATKRTPPAKPKQASKPARDPAAKLTFLPWNPVLVKLWCNKKEPITPEAIQAVGGKLARYRRQHSVIALPVWGEQGSKAAPVNYLILRANGDPLPIWDRDGNVVDQAKIKTIGGGARGLLGRKEAIDSMLAGTLPEGTTVWKVEGPTDLLALESAGLPEGHIAVTNPFGARDMREQPEWLVNCFRGLHVNIVHDMDKAGQQGAAGWAKILSPVAESVRNVKLPDVEQPTHGMDLRDFFNNSNTWETLLELAGEAAPIEPATATSGAIDDLEELENPHDPARLARVNVRQYRQDHGGELRFWQGEWWRYKAGRWLHISDDEIDAKVRVGIGAELQRIAENTEPDDNGRQPQKKSVTNALVSNVLGAMRSQCFLSNRIEMPCMLSEPAARRELLSMENGLLDIAAVAAGEEPSKAFTDHTPDWFSATKVEYAFDPEATAPNWQRYLESSLPDAESRSLAQEWAGYVLTTRNPFQKFMALEGEGGTGKSVFAVGLTAMLGEASVSNAELKEFGTRFGLSETIGKAMNIDADVSQNARFSEGAFKKFSIGERMSFEFKGKNIFSQRPTAKVVLIWNNRPRINDTSDGFWRRMLLVPFTRKIPTEEKIVGMDQVDWWQESGELPGIFNWAIEGLQRLYRQKGFTEPEAMRKLIRQYRNDLNPIQEFIEGVVRHDRELEKAVSTDSIVATFRGWCRDNASPDEAEAMNNRKMGRAITSAFGIESERISANLSETGKRCRGFKGIYFVDDEENKIEQPFLDDF